MEIEEAKKETLLKEVNILKLNLTSKIDKFSSAKNKIVMETKRCRNALTEKKKEIEAILIKLKDEIDTQESDNENKH